MDNLKVIYLIENKVEGKDAILRILTINNTLTLDDAERHYYEQLAAWANSNKTKITNINLDTVELSDRSLIGKGISAKTGSLLRTLNELNEKLGKKASANGETARKVQQLTVEILAWFSKIERSNKEKVTKLRAGMDWTAEKANRLANTDGKAASEILDEFYNDYYKIEYAGLKSPEDSDTTGIVDKLESLDKILIQEFNKLGYNPAVNPLAQFLKLLIKHKFNAFQKLNTNNYGAIHNAFIDKYITGNMLGNFDSKNIIFCDDLYNYKGLDIVKYLSIQKTILDAAKKKKEYSSDPGLIATKILIRQNDTAHENDQYTEKVKALLSSSNAIPPAQAGARLRSINEISELYRYIFQDVLDTSTRDDDDELTDIVNRAVRNKIVLSMIRVILDQRIFKKEFADRAKEYEKWLEELQYKSDKKSIEKCKKILFEDDTTLDAKDMLELIKRLIKAYNSNRKVRVGK